MFLAVLGLCHCMGFSLAAEMGERGLLSSYDGLVTSDKQRSLHAGLTLDSDVG